MCLSAEHKSKLEVSIPLSLSSSTKDNEGRLINNVAVSLDGLSLAQDVNSMPSLLQSRNTTRIKKVKCPLRILLAATLGILCTFLTYLCLPDSCSGDNQSRRGHGKTSTKLMSRYGHLVKRDLRSETIAEEIGKDAKLKEFCNISPYILEKGQEDQIIDDKYDLLQVHMLITPGQRALVGDTPGIPSVVHSCMLDQLAIHNDDVWNFMQEAISFQENNHYKSAFKKFELYPFGARCFPGQFLPEGVLQGIRMGKLLKKAYERRININENNQIHIYSQVDELQYQSAIAFLFGFLERQSFQKIHIHKGNENFCEAVNGANCRCKQTEELRPFVQKAISKGHYMFKSGFKPVRKEISTLIGRLPSNLGSILETSKNVLLRACLEKPLLNDNSKDCLSNALVKMLLNETSQYFQGISRDTVFRSFSKLQSFPFLKKLEHSIVNVTKNSSRIFLYSTEEDLILHVLSALGLPIIDIPPFATRLVVEIYSKSTDNRRKNYFLRILHDGIDRTKNISFCFDKLVDGFCPFELFKEFLLSSAILGKPSYDHACR